MQRTAWQPLHACNCRNSATAGRSAAQARDRAAGAPLRPVSPGRPGGPGAPGAGRVLRRRGRAGGVGGAPGAGRAAHAPRRPLRHAARRAPPLARLDIYFAMLPNVRPLGSASGQKCRMCEVRQSKGSAMTLLERKRRGSALHTTVCAACMRGTPENTLQEEATVKLPAGKSVGLACAGCATWVHRLRLAPHCPMEVATARSGVQPASMICWQCGAVHKRVHVMHAE